MHTKDGKKKKKNKRHRLYPEESASCFSLSQYYDVDGVTISGEDPNIYAWSVTMSVSEDDGADHHDLVKKPQHSNEGDPLDDIDIRQLRMNDIPVKSSLQSSTMQLGMIYDHAPVPKKREKEEKLTGPIDVDDLREVPYKDSEPDQSDFDSRRSHPLHRRAGDEVEERNSQNASGTHFETIIRDSSLSSVLSTNYGSEGDSLRNLGDDNVDCTQIQSKLSELETEVQQVNNFRAMWLAQGNVETANLHADHTVGKLVPKPQLELLCGQSETQKERMLMRTNKVKRRGKGEKIKDKLNKNKNSSASTQRRKKKKSIKSQVITTFQTLLRSNSHDVSVNRNSRINSQLPKPKLQKNLSCISMIPIADGEPPYQTKQGIPKAELRRDVSTFSTTPLTGDTVIDFPKTKKLQNAKELLLEKERRRVLAGSLQLKQEKRKEIERQRQLCELELKKKHKQFCKDVDKYFVPTVMEKVENSRNRQKLQNWVMGCSNLTMDPSPGGDNAISSALSEINDIKITAHSGRDVRSPHDESTAKADNTLPNPNTLTRCREGFNKIEGNYSDDISSTFTSEAEASPPPQHSLLCVHCGEANRTHLAVPCMHFAYCENCVREMEKNEKKVCMICNERNVNFRKLLW